VRSPDTSIVDLKALPVASGGKLIIEPLASDTADGTSNLIFTLISGHGITHINTVILNAGIAVFTPLLTTPLSSLREHLEVNALAPISLFQAAYPLMSKASNPKLTLITSSLGSIGEMDSSPSLAYGMSKAAANYFVREVHFECANVTALAVHPG
jgi:norsolorinic acid ketoreductase